MAYEYGRDLLPSEIQHFQRDLGAFTAIKEKQLPVPSDKGGGKESSWKRHHATGA